MIKGILDQLANSEDFKNMSNDVVAAILLLARYSQPSIPEFQVIQDFRSMKQNIKLFKPLKEDE